MQLKITPYRHQIVGIERHLASKEGFANFSEPGCIDGNVELQINRAGRGFKIKLKDLFHKFNGGSSGRWGKGYKWDLNIPTYTRSLCDGILRANKIKEVIYQGEKPTLNIILKSGKTITVTADHEIAIPNGWARADSLSVNDEVLTNGIPMYVPKVDYIESVSKGNVVKVYDIVMEDPYRNFVANGIIVHNCGKTLMSIGAMNLMNVERVLVVCPNSLKLNWEREIREASKREWLTLIPSGRKKDFNIFMAVKRRFKVIITNYESLTKYAKEIATFAPELVIADEATAIKSHKAKRTKALKAIKTRYKLAMTGTPVANNPLDVWSIMDWIRPGHLHPNFYAFRSRYCDIYTGAGFPIIKRFRNMDELKKKVDRYSYRVLKEECLDLPEKIFIRREFDLSPEERRVYKGMADDMIAEVGDHKIAASIAIVKLMRLQQITGGFIQNMVGSQLQVHATGVSKLKNLEELLEELGDKKVLVWAKFKEEVRLIAELCRSLGRVAYRFTGDETTEEREQAVRDFQSVEGNQVFVGTAAAGGMGITLTAASYCVYYSNSFSLTDRLQSQDRIHRLGQGNTCVYYDLVARQTVDAYILNKLEKKVELSDQITGDDLKKIAYSE